MRPRERRRAVRARAGSPSPDPCASSTSGPRRPRPDRTSPGSGRVVLIAGARLPAMPRRRGERIRAAPAPAGLTNGHARRGGWRRRCCMRREAMSISRHRVARVTAARVERAARRAACRRSGGEPGMPASCPRGPCTLGNEPSRPRVYGCAGSWICVGAADLDHLARVHDRDAVRDLEQQREVVGDEEDREVRARSLQRDDLREDLALDDDVERCRRLVHDHDLGLERRAPSRSSRAGAFRRRARAGSCAGARAGCRRDRAARRSRSALLLAASLRCASSTSPSWSRIAQHRVQRVHRALEDDRDLAPAQLAQLARCQIQDVDAAAGRGCPR